MNVKSGIVPEVEHQVAVNAIADLLRPMVEDGSTDPIVDEMVALNLVQPELMKALRTFADGSPNPAYVVSGAIVAYLIIQAQMEVEDLKRLEGVCAEQSGASAPAL